MSDLTYGLFVRGQYHAGDDMMKAVRGSEGAGTSGRSARILRPADGHALCGGATASNTS